MENMGIFMTISRIKGPKKEKVLSEKEYVIQKKRSERALSLREVLNLPRIYFKEKYNVSPSTLQMWEDLEKGGVGEDAARRLAAIYQQEGLSVTPEWLMYGVGPDPLDKFRIGSTGFGKSKIHVIPEGEGHTIADELRLFHETNKESVHLVIDDDGFSPWLVPGDYVAGKRYWGDDIKKAIGCVCIVEIDNGETLVRLIRTGSAGDYYNLVCTNPESIISNRILHDIKLISAAPIIRIWKPKPSQF